MKLVMCSLNATRSYRGSHLYLDRERVKEINFYSFYSYRRVCAVLIAPGNCLFVFFFVFVSNDPEQVVTGVSAMLNFTGNCVFVSVYLCICVSVYLSIYVSVYLCICVFVYLSGWQELRKRASGA